MKTKGNNNPIGVYDSGLGGLSVWRELHAKLPNESLTYLADGANCPYGGRPKEEIRRFADQAVGALIADGAKMVVVACNTATAAAIDFLRAKYANIPIVGMEPAVKPAAMATRTGVVGVLATAGSLGGDLFLRTSARYADLARFIAAVGEGFVEIVEQSREATPEAEEAVRRVVEPLLDEGADQIVLGCTHYPFLREVIERVIGNREVAVIDPAPAVARRVEQLLDQFNLRADEGNEAQYRFKTFASDDYLNRLTH
ncbi:MAG: glutamate racemase, partial [Rikenellaceae bacterium]|nr:glutamate racemase [Rikenellaceae bacterium]MBR3800623.1 glutamate racemase [Rikenellaceae bacterium]